MDFDAWLATFAKDKKEVGSFDQSGTDAVHSVRRYLSQDKRLFEVALTYTGAVVTRSGVIGNDAVSVRWSPWNTEHNVEYPKR
ncbi:MAG: hypothetical protein HYZ71_04720 [Deltaproteobacteria bacterium]|nr:hypothetical protein [Deltaproteobacteria bacterium]